MTRAPLQETHWRSTQRAQRARHVEPLASVTTAQWALRSARAVGVVTAGRFSATFMFAVFMAVVFVNSTNNLATFRGEFL